MKLKTKMIRKSRGRDFILKTSNDLLQCGLYSVDYYRYLYYLKLKKEMAKGYSKKTAINNSLNAIIEIYKKTQRFAKHKTIDPDNFKKSFKL